MSSTPEQFARKLARLPQAVKERDRKALEARARVTKTSILSAAAARSKAVRPKWVQYRISGDVAEVRLRGGFAYLTEKGSYKKPDGWDEGPKGVTNRRIRSAAKKGVTLSEKKAVMTPEGPRARVHHPQLRARPFWQRGIDASRVPARKAYQREAVTSAIKTIF